MEIHPIEKYFPPSLTIVSLNALVPDRDPYSVMLLQPTGSIIASESRVGHSAPEHGKDLCKDFLINAVEQKVDLLVTPEYCLPWDIAEDILNNVYKPEIGAIWVLGCESITPQELDSFEKKTHQKEDVWFHHEPLDPRQVAQKRFIDPLLYVFWSLRTDGNYILCMVLQLKTTPCKDYWDFEQRSLITGSVVYSFNRELNKISLITIICSDAFNFIDYIDTFHSNCLLIHIQMNPKPAHRDFAQYRTRLCSVGTNSHVELLCLNWAQNICEITPTGEQKDWGNVAGSAWYAPPSKFLAKQDWIDTLHRHGVYYNILLDRWHSFFLKYNEQVLLLQKQKIFTTQEQALVPKTFLDVRNRWEWSDIEKKWLPSVTVCDGFTESLSMYNDLKQLLSDLCKDSPLAVECALEFLCGPKGNPTSWFKPCELESFHLDVDESFRRVTIFQKAGDALPGASFRRTRLQRAQDAITLPGNGVPWPEPLKDLENGFQFNWKITRPHHNIISNDTNKGPASLIYLGEQSDLFIIEKTYQKARQSLQESALIESRNNGQDPVEAITKSIDRLCVIYRYRHQYKIYKPKDVNNIAEPGLHSAVDITRE